MLNFLFWFNIFAIFFCAFGPETKIVFFEENRALFILLFLGCAAVTLIYS